MTSRERVLSAVRRQCPDRLPLDFRCGFAPFQMAALKRITGYDDPEEYFQTDTRGVGAGPSRKTTDFSRYFKDFPARATLDEWGVGHLPTDSPDPRHSHFDGFVYPMVNLTTVAELMEYPFPDFDAEYRYEQVPEQVADQHGRGLCSVGHLECTIFESAWYMRSMEQLMIDFIDNPDFATGLLDVLATMRCNQAKLLVESGVDILHLGDDIAGQRGMLMSVPMWRRWLKPRLARVIDAAKHVKPNILIGYHTDGNPMAVIPDLIEIGVDILDPVQPECIDPIEVADAFGDRLSFQGCIGTQSLLPFGTPDKIRETVHDLAARFSTRGGLILAPTHMVEPEVPWENIVALVDAVKGSATATTVA